jgi:hypothetical protein
MTTPMNDRVGVVDADLGHIGNREASVLADLPRGGIENNSRTKSPEHDV